MQNFIEEIFTTPEIWSNTIELDRNEFLIKAGEKDQKVYFVEKGALRVFYLSEFEEITIRFGYKKNFITSLPSFFNNEASLFYIQAIRKTILKTIDKKVFVDFIEKTPARKEQYRLFIEELVSQQIEREIDILTYSPIERLKRVQERSPQLFQEIPAKYIASYLRMTPETLSRIHKS